MGVKKFFFETNLLTETLMCETLCQVTMFSV